MADTPITIRDCAARDLDTLEQHDPRPSDQVARKHFAAAEGSDVVRFFVAFDDDQPLAWAMLDGSDEDLGPQLSSLWVFPEARRRGIGRLLSEHIEAVAAEQGADEIFLLVDPDNGRAVALWLDLGYRPTGEHKVDTTVESGEQTHQAIYRKSIKQL